MITKIYTVSLSIYLKVQYWYITVYFTITKMSSSETSHSEEMNPLDYGMHEDFDSQNNGTGIFIFYL